MILKQNRKIPIILFNDTKFPNTKAMGIKSNFRNKIQPGTFGIPKMFVVVVVVCVCVCVCVCACMCSFL